MTANLLSNSAEAIARSEQCVEASNSLDGGPENADLDKVRELLFGNQARSSEQHFKALEAELVLLKTDFEERLARLEDIVQKGFDSITQQIQAEREERQSAIVKVNQSQQETEASLVQKQAQLSQKIDSEARALQQKTLDMSSQFSDALHQKSQDFLRDLNQESQRRQQQERAHKSRLSALFEELSERLKDE